MNSDLLDEYCQEEFGHTDWEMSWDAEMNVIIKFFANARPEWLEENIEPDGEHDDDEEDETPHEFSTTSKFTIEEGLAPTPMRMRKDLAREDMQIPACFTYSDYDTMDEPVLYLSSDDMDGAVSYDNGVDTDDHAFCVVKLKDGRVVYMLGIDLDWGDIE